MSEIELLSLMVVGSDPPDDTDAVSYVAADSAERAAELLKLLRFDLVVVVAGPARLPSECFTDTFAASVDSLRPVDVIGFVRHMRSAQPWQRWLLAGVGLIEAPDDCGTYGDQLEVAARCNGALAVFDDLDWAEIGHLAGGMRTRSKRVCV